MNGIHDCGGMDGFGPVQSDDGAEEVFRADWEKVCFAMFAQGARAGLFNLDQFRFAIEQMDPAEYLLSNYYEHWSHVIEHFGPEKGVFDIAELEKRAKYYAENPDAPLPADANPDVLEFVNAVLVSGAPCSLESDKAPRFAPGDTVRVREDSPTGHTRRARYIRGRTGVVIAGRGTYVYPETSCREGKQVPEHVYTVKFSAADLWGDGNANQKDTVCVDMWEPYIEPAAASAAA